ncbi:MAG: SRPBCC family protein [Acidobacteria bacterium]|nr:SRPBCC family protein [Acidobacteriota bacterium]
MFWPLVAIVVLVAVILFVTLIGILLPEEHVASRTIALPQPPQTIWQVVSDFGNTPTWNSEVKSVERLPDRNGHEVWQEEYQRGMKIPLETIESVAPRRLVRRIADENLPFGGTWEYIITPTTEGGSQLIITERGKVRNPVFRFMSRYVFGHATTIDNYLKALAAKFGEPVTIR